MGIQIDQLCVAYGEQRVIDGLTLHIEPGSLFTLLGPSGCGKTTLLRTIAGFIPVQSGRLAFAGRDVTQLRAHERNIGMVFQDYALFPTHTVSENVAYGLRARKVDEPSIKRRCAEAMERVGLAQFGERLPAALSGGQRQRVALARALVIKPQVLLMDEPLSNLDAKLRLQVRETIAELQREAGITTVFVTHDQEEALALSDRIAVMNKGRIEQLGTSREVYERPATAFVADFIGAANVVPITCPAAPSGLITVPLAGGQVRATAPSPIDSSGSVLVARPEDIAITSAKGTAEGTTLIGRVKSQQYLGVKTSLRVELAGGLTLHVERRSSDEALANDATVGLSFDPLKTLVLAS